MQWLASNNNHMLELLKRIIKPNPKSAPTASIMISHSDGLDENYLFDF